ncbi:hypothetical protein IQ268_07270 [Oculatella sp. LEGE 06141]|uniref:Pepco domain-containing protein n=1 Tax=Oculatella sp. LEGE 06141 TaxID=1828648 RepID=UPI001880AC83|nr:hypothetical protein [Oculatella sp. LEGE 06141]MBE9178387.1 hypothetical protein [Oculatella sp. LEGE 06141]
MTQNSIWIVTNDAEPVTGEGQRGWSEEVRRRIAGFKEVKLPVAELEQKMGDFLQVVSRLFKQAEQQIDPASEMRLEEVELLVEISAKGEVKLVAGGEAAGKGAITLKFKRSDSR